MKRFIYIISFFLCFSCFAQLPEGFVYAETVIPDLHVELRYFSDYNFVGNKIEGYRANRLILTTQATNALKKVQAELLRTNKCLLIYDGYRPQRAVNHFMRWARDVNDTINKGVFYPNINKRYLFKEGYIASRSGHSRGSTLDLTIVDGSTNKPLDMGSPYDFFGPVSWVESPDISEEQKRNRQLLQEVMKKYGFRPYAQEWWHFTLRGEPFPDTYFDFPIE